VTDAGSEETPESAVARWWKGLTTRRRYAVVLGGLLLLALGAVQVVEVVGTGRVWPSVRESLLFVAVVGAAAPVLVFAKKRRIGPALLSAAGLAAVLAAAWWGVPSERALVSSAAENVTGFAALGVAMVPALHRRLRVTLLAAAGVLAMAFGTVWVSGGEPAVLEALAGAARSGAILGGVAGAVLYVSEDLGLVAFPWREDGAGAA